MQLGKFDSDRDSFLHYLCVADWANESSGNSDSPTGFFCRIELDDQDVAITNTEFNSVLEEYLEHHEIDCTQDELRNSLIGYFVITEDSNGLVYVKKFDEWFTGEQMYRRLDDAYMEWDSQDDESDYYG